MAINTKQHIKRFRDAGFTIVGDNTTLSEFINAIDQNVVMVAYSDGTTEELSNGIDFGLSIGKFFNVVGYKITGRSTNLSAIGKIETVVSDEILNHPLYPIFVEAIQQLIYGKGERHGGGKIPFMEQSWIHTAKRHGNGFLTGQSCKKIEEAAETRTGESFDAEVLGGINYAAMSILHRRMETGREEFSD